MTAAGAFNDIGDLYDGFYDAIRRKGAQPEPGQVVFCPVIENDRRLRIGEVARSDSYAHTRVEMNIREQQKQDFRGKDNRLPIRALNLDRTHELVIARAKLRPCVVIGCCNGIDVASIPDGEQRRLATKGGFYPIYLLAPGFHVATAAESSSFAPIVTARIKCLMYPEFFYLRQSGGFLRVPTVIRLDRMFLQAPHPGSGFELTDCFIRPEIYALVAAQVKYLLGQALSKEYLEVRDLMLTTLPDEAKPAG